VRDDERSLLWEKLAFLAPAALATTALDASLGAVREDARFVAAREEAFAVALAEGATIDELALVSLHDRAPEGMRSSMQKDVEAGREPELDAIAGPIIRGGQRHGILVPATRELARLVESGRRL
jgi:2-dehydropantoate 2-reductase